MQALLFRFGMNIFGNSHRQSRSSLFFIYNRIILRFAAKKEVICEKDLFSAVLQIEIVPSGPKGPMPGQQGKWSERPNNLEIILSIFLQPINIGIKDL